MIATVQVELAGGIKFEVSSKLEKLSDLAALGRALQRKSRDASKLFPALASEKVASLKMRNEPNGKRRAASSEKRAAE
jgi:hypothetical protein